MNSDSETFPNCAEMDELLKPNELQPLDGPTFHETYNQCYKTQPCPYYLDGLKCPRGWRKCTYVHPEDRPLKVKQCPRLAQGEICKYGRKCFYLHPEEIYLPQFQYKDVLFQDDEDEELLNNPDPKLAIDTDLKEEYQDSELEERISLGLDDSWSDSKSEIGPEPREEQQTSEIGPMGKEVQQTSELDPEPQEEQPDTSSKRTLRQKHPCYKTRPCPDFLAGMPCRYGNDCFYLHPDDKPLKTRPCKNIYTRGWCPYESKCTYAHPGDKCWKHHYWSMRDYYWVPRTKRLGHRFRSSTNMDASSNELDNEHTKLEQEHAELDKKHAEFIERYASAPGWTSPGSGTYTPSDHEKEDNKEEEMDC